MMDQDTAQVLFREGAFLIMNEVLEGTEFGIDYLSWNVGPRFRGVKMIPPGLHFVYYSACSKEGDTGPRKGFFHNFEKKEIIVKRWNKLEEDIEDEQLSSEDLQRYHDNICDLDRNLGPYPYEHYKKWVSLTNHLTWSLCKGLQPVRGRVAAVTDFISSRSNTQSRKDTMEANVRDKSSDQSNECLQDERGETSQSNKRTQEKEEADSEPKNLREAESKLPQMEVKEDSMIRFNKIPQKYPTGSSPTQITKYSMDSSYALEKMISECYNGDENGILGEIQFSFICLLIGQIYDAFDQWKHLVHLLCSCEDALMKHENLFANFITILYFQVQEIPEDFFVDIVSQNNFLTTTLQEFFSNVEGCPLSNTLRKKALRFREHLTQKFKWDFTSEPDDCAPVVVDLS
ncbi:hypothetical protein FSP39_023327 [Pinctada imbricata]|uniref:Protein AAR2 homolog n=1 Tax=Pinctada imbricata TaxID=66713 RepID=A0AA88YLN2_PINIB|nr:hypothetical protein FSP39_023327 [Pinctada imbricata]